MHFALLKIIRPLYNVDLISLPYTSILSRPQRSEGRIEGCGLARSRRLRRTLRYALHVVSRYSGCVLSLSKGCCLSQV